MVHPKNKPYSILPLSIRNKTVRESLPFSSPTVILHKEKKYNFVLTDMSSTNVDFTVTQKMGPENPMYVACSQTDLSPELSNDL